MLGRWPCRVRYYCTNHATGLWLEGKKCPQCGEEFGRAAVALLSVTLGPALMVIFVRGRIVPEHKNPINRFLFKCSRHHHSRVESEGDKVLAMR